MNAYKLRNRGEALQVLFRLYDEYDKLHYRAATLLIETRDTDRKLKAERLEKTLREKRDAYYKAWSLLVERRAYETETNLIFA